MSKRIILTNKKNIVSNNVFNNAKLQTKKKQTQLLLNDSFKILTQIIKNIYTQAHKNNEVQNKRTAQNNTGGIFFRVTNGIEKQSKAQRRFTRKILTIQFKTRVLGIFNDAKLLMTLLFFFPETRRIF